MLLQAITSFQEALLTLKGLEVGYWIEVWDVPSLVEEYEALYLPRTKASKEGKLAPHPESGLQKILLPCCKLLSGCFTKYVLNDP